MFVYETDEDKPIVIGFYSEIYLIQKRNLKKDQLLNY